MELFEHRKGVETRWVSFENPTGVRGRGGLENAGAKGHAFDSIDAGETKTLLDISGSGTICRIWMTIDDRSPEMLRSLRLEMFWDGADRPAVSVPFGDFFGIAHGLRTAFESALFSDPEGRSFNCFIPMPFRTAAKITLTNESGRKLLHLFYDIDLLTSVEHRPSSLYFHAHWRRERPNTLGQNFAILPRVEGAGRFLGFNAGIIADGTYEGSWWGEGEVKVFFGDEEHSTLCGTGTEDYIGTGWGQGVYGHRTQGCLIADKENRRWAFYRYHVDDPIFFHDACRVEIQTIGGDGIKSVVALAKKGVPLIPVSIDHNESGFEPLIEPAPAIQYDSEQRTEGWCNFWRQDDWCSTAYFYLDRPGGALSPLATVEARTIGASTYQ